VVKIARAQAASLWQAITDRVAEGLYVADSDGSILYVNQSGLRMLGYGADELIGRDSQATLHHNGAEHTAGPVTGAQPADARGTGATYEAAEERLRRKDGSMLAVVSSSSPVQLESGTGNVVVFRDVSAQRATRRRSEALHRTLIANLPNVSVFLLDHDLRVMVAEGQASRRFTWFDEDMFIGRKVTELYADIPKHLLDLGRALSRRAAG